jgi:hypothetical protein
MITSELIMEKVNNYSNKDIVDKVESVIDCNDFNLKMMQY